jgi:hypothetical protein
MAWVKCGFSRLSVHSTFHAFEIFWVDPEFVCCVCSIFKPPAHGLLSWKYQMGQSQSSSSSSSSHLDENHPLSKLFSLWDDIADDFDPKVKKDNQSRLQREGCKDLKRLIENVEKDLHYSTQAANELGETVRVGMELITLMIDDAARSNDVKCVILMEWAMKLVAPCIKNNVMSEVHKNKLYDAIFGEILFHAWYHPDRWKAYRKDEILSKYAKDSRTEWMSTIRAYADSIWYIKHMETFWKNLPGFFQLLKSNKDMETVWTHEIPSNEQKYILGETGSMSFSTLSIGNIITMITRNYEPDYPIGISSGLLKSLNKLADLTTSAKPLLLTNIKFEFVNNCTKCKVTATVQPRGTVNIGVAASLPPTAVTCRKCGGICSSRSRPSALK